MAKAWPHRLASPVQVTEGNDGDFNEVDQGFFATSDITDEELMTRIEQQDWDILTEEASTTTTLSLSWCQLTRLPPQVPSLTQLTRLYITYNGLENLPEGFQHLRNLQILNLGFNTFQRIPHVIFQLDKLKVLFMKNNQLTTDGIGEGIGNLSRLVELYLGNNNIEDFPRPLCGMSNLVLLTLSSNAIKEIPEEIADMAKLKVLKMRSNRLKQIPEAFGQLKSLELACFAQNMIDDFPFHTVESLSKLRDLCLYANRLRDREKLVECLQIFTERGGLFRAEENRVRLPSMGGVCDRPFQSWAADILFLHDGEPEVKSWVDQMSRRLTTSNLTSQDFGPNDNKMQTFMKRSRIVAVVCTHGMSDLLWEKGERGTTLQATLDDLFLQTPGNNDRRTNVWLLVYNGGVSTFFISRGCEKRLERSPNDAQDVNFFRKLVNVINNGSLDAANSTASPRL